MDEDDGQNWDKMCRVVNESQEGAQLTCGSEVSSMAWMLSVVKPF